MLKLSAIGDKYNKLTLVSKESTKYHTVYTCKCDCGNIVIRRTSKVGDNDLGMCYLCKLKEKYLYKEFNYLLVIDIAPPINDNRSTWKCKCLLCGNYKDFVGERLKYTLSCGCLQSTFNHNKSRLGKNSYLYKGYQDISLSNWNHIVQRARLANFEFSITIEYIWDLFIKQNKKCALTGRDIRLPEKTDDYEATASLDRIDSKIGYIKSNVQWIHKDLQKMKWDYNQDYYINTCRQVAHYADSIYPDNVMI